MARKIRLPASRSTAPASVDRGAGVSKRRAVATSEPYNVGYGKPPKAGQFRKGQSGNRQGRPKGAKNVATLLVEALNETIMVTDDGSPRPVSKLEMAFQQLADRGAAGDLRALRMIFDRLDAVLNRVDIEHADALDAADREVAQALILRIRSAPQEACHD